MNLATAYRAVCPDAQKTAPCYLSLYENQPFYGGPEEGGWWGSDTVCHESKWFASRELAEEAKRRAEDMVAQYNREAQERSNSYDSAVCDRADMLGIDNPDDLFGPGDGASEFYMVIENSPAEFAGRGERGYS